MSKHRRNRSNKIIRMPYLASKGNLRFIQTEDMTLNEVKEWEGKYKTVSVNSDDGAIIEKSLRPYYRRGIYFRSSPRRSSYPASLQVMSLITLMNLS